MKIRLDPDEFESLVEFLRYGQGRIAAAVVPGPAVGNVLIERIRQAIGREKVQVAASTNGYPEPMSLGDRARELAPDEAIFVIPLDGRWHAENPAEARKFWRRLNYQREHLAADGVCTLLLLDDASDRYLTLEADDLREWVRVFRFPTAHLPISQQGWIAQIGSALDRSASEEQLGVLRDQLRRARELGLPEAELVDKYATPLFEKLVWSEKTAEARKVWERELRGGQAIRSWRLPQALRLWSSRVQLLVVEGRLEKADELSKDFLEAAEADFQNGPTAGTLAAWLEALAQRSALLTRRYELGEAAKSAERGLQLTTEPPRVRNGPSLPRTDLQSYSAHFIHVLGLVAQLRGSYDEALDWYRKSLEISERLENYSAMASTYYQLGNLAFVRGAYADAESMYRKALQLSEDIGNLAGMANAYRQIGAVAVETGKLEEGVLWHLRALDLLRELGPSGIWQAVFWFTRDEDLLGEDRFWEILDKHLEDETRDGVLEMMEQFRQAQQAAEKAQGVEDETG